MDDLISRQAILDMLEDINNHIIDGCGYKHDWCVEWVKGLPTKDAVPHWIPCEKRLPEEGVVVVTVDKDGEYEINAIIDEEDGEWFWEKPVAWMPLPKPYEAERKES